MHPPAAMFVLLVITGCSLLATNAQQQPQVAAPASASCVSHERDALLAFKHGVTSDPGGLLSSWRRDGDQDCCRWRGVWCSNRTGHVRKLRLCGTGAALVGQISPSLLALERLKHLDLSENKLQGATGRLPEFLGYLKSLKYLNLSGIEFSGNLPPQLGNLSKLQYLDLSFMGSTYSTDISWLTHLPSLQYLNLNKVNLSTQVNWPRVMNMIPSLRVLHLHHCSLASANQPLPHLNLTNLEELEASENTFNHRMADCWFWNVTSLRYLDLGHTSLYGELPAALGNLTSLVLLDLSSNNITGPLPASIGLLTDLQTLDLSDNYLTGHVPFEIGMLTNMTSLYLNNNEFDGVITEEHFGARSLKNIDLSYNTLKIEHSSDWRPPFSLESANFAACQMGPLFPRWLQWQVNIIFLDISSAYISDQLPQWFSTAFSNVKILNMSNNKLHGGLPTNLGFMSLGELYLSSNQLTGQIHTVPLNISALDLSNNSLSGPLPDTGSANMMQLSLFSNQFTGRIPESYCKYERLAVLDLSNNLLEGELPPCLGMMENMKFIALSNNRFLGQFPPFLQNFTRVLLLDLSRNKFSGRLPSWIGNLKFLRILRLDHNKFFGNIPANITHLHCLQFMDLNNNEISGSLPANLSNLKAMRTVDMTDMCHVGDVAHYRLIDLCVVIKEQERDYGSISRIFDINMTSIDLSSNNLTGPIPEEIIVLDALMNLNLSRNNISGVIPNKIGEMQSLVSLDLSKNKIYGEIPATLSDLMFLSYLNLSYNNLTGRIPPGSQLDTLYAENPYMYIGNVGLCGHPLQNDCLGDRNASKQGRPRRMEPNGIEFFCLGLGCGFVAGNWVVFGVLLFKRSWRIAYFQFLDKLHNKACLFWLP